MSQVSILDRNQTTAAPPTTYNEQQIILLIALVQFVNVLDFVMVMPLGPDFSTALKIPIEKLGLIGGSYTAAACVSGVIGSFFLDRFDRKTALFAGFLGLSFATMAGALATGLYSLLAARVAAGFFAGPATSVAMSIIADIIPADRRGRAMGTVMTSFAAASILGIPAGLELARLGGWYLPFLGVGVLGLVVCAGAVLVLPSMRGHMIKGDETSGFPMREFMKATYLLSFTACVLMVLGQFLMIPNLSAYFQFNLGWPREKLGMLYLVGGTLSLFATKLGGIWTDRKGSFPPIIAATVLFLASLTFGFVFYSPVVPVLAIFVSFMLGSSARFVALNTLVSKVPTPSMRARFMSVLSAVQHLSSSFGAILSTIFLKSETTGKLIGMPRLAIVTIVLTLLTPIAVWFLEKRVRHAS